MDRMSLIESLIDFHEGRNRFEERNEYVGMEASTIPELFAAYFEQLTPADQRDQASVIVAGVIGEIEALVPYVLPTLTILLSLCMRGYTRSFIHERDALEWEFNDPDNVRQWLAAPDNVGLLEGLAVKADWHYALMLWNVLYFLKAEQSDSTYHILRNQAQAPEFRQGLADAKMVADVWLPQFGETS